MNTILRLDRFFNWIAQVCGALATLAMVALLFNVFYDVVMRYAFSSVAIGMQELEWHLFATAFLLGIPYAMQKDGHVRVDIFYEAWPDTVKAWVNILGACIFVLPFSVLIVYFGVDFAREAFEINEGSGDPGGLPHRWIVKSLIPISLALVGVASLGMVTQALKVLVGKQHYSPPSPPSSTEAMP